MEEEEKHKLKWIVKGKRPNEKKKLEGKRIRKGRHIEMRRYERDEKIIKKKDKK